MDSYQRERNPSISDHRKHSGGQLVLRGEEARLHGRAQDHRNRALHTGELYQKCPDIKVRGPASDLKLKVPIPFDDYFGLLSNTKESNKMDKRTIQLQN